MTLLYDVFYQDGSFDANIRLPKKAETGARAVCKNWDGHVYIAKAGEWVKGANQ